MPWVFSIPVFVFGLIWGSFYNVVALRVPKGESIVPRSHCPACGHELSAYELVPILSWVWLRGRCRQCKEHISPMYPLGELVTALLFLWSFNHFGLQWETLLAWFLSSIIVIATLTDIKYRIIPNWLVGLALAGGIMGRLLLPLPGGLLGALSGILPGGLFLLIVNLISRGGLGEGDVKFAAVLGLFMGWQSALVGLYLSICLGGLFVAILLILRKAQRKSTIPFGPFLAMGFWIAYLYGMPITSWYAHVL